VHWSGGRGRERAWGLPSAAVPGLMGIVGNPISFITKDFAVTPRKMPWLS